MGALKRGTALKKPSSLGKMWGGGGITEGGLI